MALVTTHNKNENKPISLALQSPQLDLVVQGEEGQEAPGLDQPQDVEVAPHVGPLRDEDAVDELQAVDPAERDHHHVAI